MSNVSLHAEDVDEWSGSEIVPILSQEDFSNRIIYCCRFESAPLFTVLQLEMLPVFCFAILAKSFSGSVVGPRMHNIAWAGFGKYTNSKAVVPPKILMLPAELPTGL